MNKLVMILSGLLLFSCKDRPYLHHKLKLEKLSDQCTGVQSSFQMNSNINGERYEFNKCLDENYESSNAGITRQGDTVVIRFNNKKTTGQSAFHITLDIDTYPRYHFLTIEGETFIIIPTGG
jgi:hypothetical protein